MTELDTYPIPNMMDFTAKETGCTIFSKVDLKKGYHQILMNPEDITKYIFICSRSEEEHWSHFAAVLQRL